MLPIYLLIFAFVVAVAIVVPVFGFGKKARSNAGNRKSAITLDKKVIQSKWADIEATANLGGPAHLKASVMDADKLVEQVLSSKGLSGNTFADMLKSGKKLFHNYAEYDNLWFAHKVRNSIAHDNDVDFSISNAKKAIEYFKKALKTLGAL